MSISLKEISPRLWYKKEIPEVLNGYLDFEVSKLCLKFKLIEDVAELV